MVLLQNVPSELCNVAMMEVVLQQAQIEASIVNCWSEDSSALGEVSLAVESLENAEQCIAHFQGCQWGVAGTSLIARFAGVQEEPVPDVGIPFEPDPLAREYSIEIERNVERLLCALLEPCEADHHGRRGKKGRLSTVPKTEAVFSERSLRQQRPPGPPAVACSWGFAVEDFSEGLDMGLVRPWDDCTGGAYAVGGCTSVPDMVGAGAAWGSPSLVGECGEGSFVEVHEVELADVGHSPTLVHFSKSSITVECNESVSTEEGTGASGTSEAELSEFLLGPCCH